MSNPGQDMFYNNQQTQSHTTQPTQPQQHVLDSRHDGYEEIVVLVFVVIFLLAIIKGVIQTFQRNWIAALLLMIFIFPVWCVWAFFEMFMSKPKPKQNIVYVVQSKDDIPSEHR